MPWNEHYGAQAYRREIMRRDSWNVWDLPTQSWEINIEGLNGLVAALGLEHDISVTPIDPPGNNAAGGAYDGIGYIGGKPLHRIYVSPWFRPDEAAVVIAHEARHAWQGENWFGSNFRDFQNAIWQQRQFNPTPLGYWDSAWERDSRTWEPNGLVLGLVDA